MYCCKYLITILNEMILCCKSSKLTRLLVVNILLTGQSDEILKSYFSKIPLKVAQNRSHSLLWERLNLVNQKVILVCFFPRKSVWRIFLCFFISFSVSKNAHCTSSNMVPLRRHIQVKFPKSKRWIHSKV